MTANEWLGVMEQAQDFPKGMDKLIIKYGEMLIAEHKSVLPAVFSANEMILFSNFIRNNYYAAGSPKMLSYHPEKYPHGKVDEIFVYWCLENGR